MAQVIYLQKGTTQVYIEAIKIEEILSNALIKIPRPIAPVNQPEEDALEEGRNPGTMTVDLKRIDHVFNIQGFLSAESGSGNESFGTAKATKDALIARVIYPKGDIELHYRNYYDTDYGPKYGDNSDVGALGATCILCQLDKISIQDVSLTRDATGTSGVQRYLLQLNLTRGKIKST